MDELAFYKQNVTFSTISTSPHIGGEESWCYWPPPASGHSLALTKGIEWEDWGNHIIIYTCSCGGALCTWINLLGICVAICSFMLLIRYPPLPYCSKVLLWPMGRREPTHQFSGEVQCEHDNGRQSIHDNGRQSIHLVGHSAHGHKQEVCRNCCLHVRLPIFENIHTFIKQRMWFIIVKL